MALVALHDQRDERIRDLGQRQHEIHVPGGDRRSGMPGNSAVFGSWAITVPPMLLIAVTPIAASLPVPVSTTPIARSRKLAATDSNNRSAEGRRKCTSSESASASRPSGLTSRWWSGGAMKTVPDLELLPGLRLLDGQAGAPGEDVRHQAAVAAVEVLDHRDRRLEIGGKPREQLAERMEAARRRGAGHHVEGPASERGRLALRVSQTITARFSIRRVAGASRRPRAPAHRRATRRDQLTRRSSVAPPSARRPRAPAR